ncbi:MAG: hypothetical protein ACK55I_43845, partial [bacterium]
LRSDHAAGVGVAGDHGPQRRELRVEVLLPLVLGLDLGRPGGQLVDPGLGGGDLFGVLAGEGTERVELRDDLRGLVLELAALHVLSS